MNDFEILQKLTGEKISEKEFDFSDCYIRPNLSLIIPSAESEFFLRKETVCPAYTIIVYFDMDSEMQTHFHSETTSPDVIRQNADRPHYYCILIEKEFFESQYRLYSEEIPVFRQKQSRLCNDILKALNTFAFEYSKNMSNSEITLDAQSVIITHLIIRSISGESFGMRAISTDYSIAKAQHYIEQHFDENITAAKLASLGYASQSSFNRRFKKETGLTPIEYLNEIRIERAKLLLRRKTIPVTEVAALCGFSSSSYFSSCFQKKMNMTPTEYQGKYKD